MALLNDITLEALLTRLVAYVVVAAIHGFVLAGMARLIGDPSPAYNGRFTLNPAPHLSMPALAMTALFQIGWIAPVRIDPEKLRFGRWGLVLCVIVAVAAVLVLSPLLWPVRQLVVTTMPRTAGYAVLILLDTIQQVAVSFAVLNILPLPPLTGQLLLVAARPSIARRLYRSRGLFEGIMVVLAITGAATGAVEAIIALARAMFGQT